LDAANYIAFAGELAAPKKNEPEAIKSFPLDARKKVHINVAPKPPVSGDRLLADILES
jgi:hypothetical protein